MSVKVSVLVDEEKEMEYSDYFDDIKAALSDIDADIDISYDPTEFMTAVITVTADNSVEKAEEVKKILLENFPDDIEQVSSPVADGNIAVMNMLDFLYEGWAEKRGSLFKLSLFQFEL